MTMGALSWSAVLGLLGRLAGARVGVGRVLRSCHTRTAWWDSTGEVGIGWGGGVLSQGTLH